ncbi:MAG: hypothetical protein QXU40_02835 [Candidatus Pacearchaeota archaeon]
MEKIKTIKGHRWYPDGKYWSFLNTNGTLERILKIFEGEKIYIDPAIQFEDLHRELLSIKYTYINRDFLNFTGKLPSDIILTILTLKIIFFTSQKKNNLRRPHLIKQSMS